MRKHALVIAATLALSFSTCWAQDPAPASAPAASAAPLKLNKPKPAPRRLTPAEQRKVNAPPLDKPPQGEVQPQIRIPLTRKQPAANKPNMQRGPEAPAPGGVNDAVARCKAQPTPQAQAQCREENGLRP
ncbi:hypothetical protein [Aquabacterium sp.]|uniref:hypothetical protein n=1 Tax=Aquabacterium sp. TaxID=1872578 RepID=UPI0035B079DA